MKQSINVLFFLCCCVVAAAQQEGIRFEQDLNWQQVKEKARADNKYIFVDCFTTWCGPCKKMSKEVFPQKEAGDFFNAQFINVKVQMDVTKNDDTTVKAWYSDAAKIAEQYGITAYPTFLFFSPDGRLVHRLVGSTATANEFIDRAAYALDPKRQYYTLLESGFKNAANDTVQLHNLLKQARENYDAVTTNKLVELLITAKEKSAGSDAVLFADSFANRSADYAFKYIANNAGALDKIKEKDYTAQKISKTVIGEALAKYMDYMGAPDSAANKPDWDALINKYTAQFPMFAAMIDCGFRKEQYLISFRSRNEQPVSRQVLSGFIKKNRGSLVASDLARFASSVFKTSTDKNYLSEALKWGEDALKSGYDKINGTILIANLNYKLGNKDIALGLMEQVLLEKSLNNYVKERTEKAITAMKAGTATW